MWGSSGFLHHPRQVRLRLLVWPRRLVVGAGEGEEGIGAVRAVVVAGTVLPDAVVVVPFLAAAPRGSILGELLRARTGEEPTGYLQPALHATFVV